MFTCTFKILLICVLYVINKNNVNGYSLRRGYFKDNVLGVKKTSL